MREALEWKCTQRWQLCRIIRSVAKKGYLAADAPELIVKYYPGNPGWGQFLEAHYLLRTFLRSDIAKPSLEQDVPDSRFLRWCEEDFIRHTEHHEIGGHFLDDLNRGGNSKWAETELRIAEARALLAEIRYAEIPLSGVVSAMKRCEKNDAVGENEGIIALRALCSAGSFGSTMDLVSKGSEAVAKVSIGLADDELRSAATRALSILPNAAM